MDASTAPAPVSDDIEIESNESAAPVESVAPSAPPEIAETPEISADPGDEDDAAVVEPPKPRNSLQARIDKAVAAQREAERRAEAAEQRLAQAQPRAEPPKQEPQYTRPKPLESEVGAKYQGYAEYVEDLTDWKLEQRDAARQTEDRQRAMAQRHETHAVKFAERIANAEKTDPEFWTKISPRVASLRPSTALAPGERSTVMNAIADVIFDSEYSTEFMAHLSANDHEFQRLSTLPPNQLFREMGKLEASLMRPAAATSGPAPKTPAISQAPPPIKPVGTTASTADRDPMSDELDVDEHIRLMNARDKKGRFTR